MSDRDIPSNERTPADLLGSILAIIHGDGGHYQAKHGDAKATEDAIAKYYATRFDALCPHGFLLADNLCGPCSQGRPNRRVVETSDESDPCVSHVALQEWERMFDAWVKHQAGLPSDVPLWPNSDWSQDVAMVAHALYAPPPVQAAAAAGAELTAGGSTQKAKAARGYSAEEALRGLYWDQVDYLTLNKLGGMNNHWMRAAREALGMEPPATRKECAPGECRFTEASEALCIYCGKEFEDAESSPKTEGKHPPCVWRSGCKYQPNCTEQCQGPI